MEERDIKIALCDDEEQFVKELWLQLEAWFSKRQLHVQFTEYTDMRSLLTETDNNRFYHILFLDIKMGVEQMDGISAARQLMDKHLRSIVVFVSSYDNYISELMEVKAFQFLHKPVREHQLNHIMELLMKELNRRWYRYTVSYKDSIHTFFLREIYYIESCSHHLRIYGKEGEPVTFLGILDREQIRLRKHGFLRIHKSFLVNMEHILRIDHKSVVMNNGRALPVSRSMRPQVKGLYLQYTGEREV